METILTRDNLLEILADLGTLVDVQPNGIASVEWNVTPKEWCESRGIAVDALMLVADDQIEAARFMLGWEAAMRTLLADPDN